MCLGAVKVCRLERLLASGGECVSIRWLHAGFTGCSYLMDDAERTGSANVLQSGDDFRFVRYCVALTKPPATHTVHADLFDKYCVSLASVVISPANATQPDSGNSAAKPPSQRSLSRPIGLESKKRTAQSS